MQSTNELEQLEIAVLACNVEGEQTRTYLFRPNGRILKSKFSKLATTHHHENVRGFAPEIVAVGLSHFCGCRNYDYTATMGNNNEGR